jgi:hypothetical protein
MSLIEKTIVSSGAKTATTTGAEVSFHQPQSPPPYICSIIASAVGAGTSLVVKIQHSPDNGTTWFDVVSFTAVTAAGSELKTVTTPILPLVRTLHTFTGGTTTSTDVVAIHSEVAR